MRTHLALFLCLSVLLSGCMTANTIIFQPEPKSGRRLVAQIVGGIGDAIIVVGIVHLLRDEYRKAAEDMVRRSNPESLGEAIAGLGVSSLLLIGATYVALAIPDILLSSSIQTENKTEPDKEPSEEDKKGD